MRFRESIQERKPLHRLLQPLHLDGEFPVSNHQSPVLVPFIFALIALSLLSSTVNGENLLLNGSMEHWHDTGLRPQGWGAWTNPKTFYKFHVSKDSKIKKDGNFSMRIETEGYVNVYTGVKLKSGEEYTLSAWVRAEKPAKMLVKYSLSRKPEYKKKVKESPKGFSKHFELKANEWQRVSVTATLPEGATGATLYFCFSAITNSYNFDRAMLNEGPIGKYASGDHYTGITPMNRMKKVGEVSFTPKSYGVNNKELKDWEVRWIFDKDPMSYARLTLPDPFLPKRIGVEFEKEILIRGIYYICADKTLPNNMIVSASVLRNGKWSVIKHKDIQVGHTYLLNFQPLRVNGVRINFLPKSGEKVKCPKLSMIGVAQ